MAVRIIRGDAREVLKTIPPQSVNLVITSPPYWDAVQYESGSKEIGHGQSYSEYLDSLMEVWDGCERVLKPNSKLCINLPLFGVEKKRVADQHNRLLLNIAADNGRRLTRETAFEYYDTYFWYKGRKVQAMFGSYPYPSNLYSGGSVEYIDVYVLPGKPSRPPDGVKEKSKLTEEEWSTFTDNLWHIQPESTDDHPAVFPIELPRRLIKMFTFVGGTVLDPFCGRGTTLRAARELERDGIGIELNPVFVRRAEGYSYAGVPDVRSWP